MAAISGFTQTFTDDFNRANAEPISGNWTQVAINPLGLASNQVVFGGGGSAQDALCRRNDWSGGNDQYSQVDLTVVGSGAGTGPGVGVRLATDGTVTGYRLVLDASGNYDLQRYNSGAGTPLRSGTLSYVAATKLGLSIIGSTLKIWYNGVQIGTNIVDGTPIAAGQPGMMYSSASTSIALDNWDAGIPTVVTAAVAVPTFHYADGAMSF